MSDNDQIHTVQRDQPVPGAFQVPVRAIGQYPEWGRRTLRQQGRNAAESDVIVAQCVLTEQTTVRRQQCSQVPPSNSTVSLIQEATNSDSRRQSSFRFPRVFRKRRTRRDDRTTVSARPDTSAFPDSPMDINPREQVALHIPAASVATSSSATELPIRSGSLRNVMSLMRSLPSRRQLSFQRVKEIFPHADEDRVVNLCNQGTSVQSILRLLAEESVDTMIEDSEGDLLPSEEEHATSGRVQSLVATLLTSQTESERVLQILEVFPDAQRESIKDQLEHTSMDAVIQELADQSLV